MKRLRPTFQWPVENGPGQYAQYEKLFLVAEQMKAFGVRCNTEKALKHKREADERAELFTQMFCELTGLKRSQLGAKGEGTTKATREWFKDAGAPDVVFDKKTKLPQFNAAAMTCWATDYAGKEFAQPAAALLGLRKAKTNARFAWAYYDVARHHDGRIHFDLNPLGTKGLRWSASAKFSWKEADGSVTAYKLNAQNVPSKKSQYDFGKHGIHSLMVPLRDCFEPDDGCVWAKFDYEGAEAALIAYNTGDALLLEWLKNGADLHTENAKICFLEDKIPADLRKIEKGHPLESRRDAMKNGMYAWTYQMPSGKGNDKYPESWKFFKQLFPNMAETYFNVLLQRFFAGHTGIKGWQLEICRRAEEDGYQRLPQNGRTIYVPPTAKGKNMSGNFYMQSGLGFLINRATPIVAQMCDWQRGGLVLLLQVHDELDLQIPHDRLAEVCEAVSAELSKPANFGGVEAGISAAPDVGPNWGDVKTYKK